MSTRTSASSEKSAVSNAAAVNNLAFDRQCACGQHTYGGECLRCKKERMPMESAAGNRGGFDTVPPIVHEVLRSPGHPLDHATREYFEPRFGYDFSRVRVHTDGRAAKSARAVNASAYTIGSDIVFAERQYRPPETEGRRVLAHELAHVVQQEGAWGHSEQLPMETAESRAEAEARQAALLIGANLPAPIKVRGSRTTIQRTLAGDIGGGVAGAAAGAALGSLGGIGWAIAGGLIGGVAGALLGDVLTAKKRSLTGEEERDARLVFGSSLNLAPVKLAEAPLMAAGGYARTPFNTVYFPPGTFDLPFNRLMPWLIHELTHVWQHQHGISVLTKVWWAIHGASAYPYGGEDALRRDAARGKRFTDYNTEQQAEIMKDYYLAKKAGDDVSAYLPFVEQVQGLPSPKPGEPPARGDFPLPAGFPEERLA